MHYLLLLLLLLPLLPLLLLLLLLLCLAGFDASLYAGARERTGRYQQQCFTWGQSWGTGAVGGGGGCGFDEETISEGGFELRVMPWWEVERTAGTLFLEAGG